MADATFIVLDAASATVTFRAQSVVGTTLVMMSVPSNLAGTALIGQAVMASSISVAISSNQSNVPFNLVSFNGTAVTIGQQVVTASIPVTLPSNQTVSTNLAQVGAVAFALGQAVMATSLPVAIASNQSAIPITGAGGTSTVTLAGGTALVTLAGGTGLVTLAGGTALLAGGTTSVNLNQINGTAISIGQAVITASFPVVLPSNQIVSTNLGQISGSAITLGQKLMASSLPVAIASDQLSPLGQTTMASSAPVVIASNQSPVGIGVIGYTSYPTAVANAATAAVIGDKLGRVVAIGAPRAWIAAQSATITTVVETVFINAINATTFADVYGLILANTGATATRVDIRYGVASAIVQAWYVPAGDTRGYMLPVDSAVPGSLSTANVSWTAQCSATTNMFVSAFYVKNI